MPLRRLKVDAGVPGRLLSVGLLLTLLLGAVVAMLVVPGLTWAEAALIAAVLAPTDAALGMAVVTDKAVPVRIRRALNIESGLNDGIATPFVTVFLAVVIGEVSDEGGSPVLDALVQIGIAIVVAIVIGGWGVGCSCGRRNAGGRRTRRGSCSCCRWPSSPMRGPCTWEATGS